MSQGIRRFKVRKDGSVHSWYRYPVTDIYNGEYCPLCLQKSIAQDCHHAVSRISTRVELGYEQHWHNNILNICTSCHERTTRDLEDSILIVKRISYFMGAVHGMRTWANRRIFEKTCNLANQISSRGKYSFLDYMFWSDNVFKHMAISHYHASFGNKYIQKVNNKNTPIFFLEENEVDLLRYSLPTSTMLDTESSMRLSLLFCREPGSQEFIRTSTRSPNKISC